MKKQCFYFLLGVVSLLLFGCNKDQTEISYYPVKGEGAKYWSFVNNEGKLVLEDAFENCPSPVIDGIFSVQEGDGFSLYEFDEKKPKLILEGLKYIGTPRNKLLPICRKDSRIEIVNTKGETVFSLDKISEKEIIECAPAFTYGYLIVGTQDEEGNLLYGAVDEKGKTVISPKYSELECAGEDLFYGVKKDEETDVFLDSKERKQGQWKSNLQDLTFFKGYVVASKEGNNRMFIYNTKGEEIVKCPEKVKEVISIEDSRYVFYGDEGYGVMTFSGETIIRPVYKSLFTTKNGYVAQRSSNEKFKAFDNEGNEIDIDAEWDRIFPIEGFGVFGIDARDAFVLDDDYKAKNKNCFNASACYSIGHSYTIISDFFDYDLIVSTITSAMQNELRNKGYVLGQTLSECNAFSSEDIQSAGRYSSHISKKYLSGNKYSINLVANFDDYVSSPVYGTRTVRRYNYYYGYYNDTERYVDHYEPNSEARINKIALIVYIPSDKKASFVEKLKAAMDGIYSNNSSYSFDESYDQFTITSEQGVIGVRVIGSYDYGRSRYDEILVEEEVVEEAPIEEAAPVEEEVAVEYATEW